MDLVAYLASQIKWSRKVFGPEYRTGGLIKHIKDELEEIEKDPDDVMEWVDVIILALDGAWRCGHSPEQICDALLRKAAINHERRWPTGIGEDQSVHHLED